MEKDTKKAILEFGGAILLIALVIGGLLFLTRDKGVTDAEKFKAEYEALNGTVRQSDGATYNEIKIDQNNPIKYVSAKEAIEVLESDAAIMYIGAPWCPWCRNGVPVLFELAKKYKVDTIYYIELDDIKSNYEVQNGKLMKTKSGTEDYYALLDKLSDRLDDYVITGEDGQKYDTGEKRVYMPYVVAVNGGKVVADKVGTVTLDANQTKYDKLTDEQHEKLTETYGNLFDLAFKNPDGACDEEGCN